MEKWAPKIRLFSATKSLSCVYDTYGKHRECDLIRRADKCDFHAKQGFSILSVKFFKLIFRYSNSHAKQPYLVHSKEQISPKSFTDVKWERERESIPDLWKRTKRVEKFLRNNGTCGSYLFSFRLSVMWMCMWRNCWGLSFRYSIERQTFSYFSVIFFLSTLSLSTILMCPRICYLILLPPLRLWNSLSYRNSCSHCVEYELSIYQTKGNNVALFSFFFLLFPWCSKWNNYCFHTQSNAFATFTLLTFFAVSKFVYRITGNKLSAFPKEKNTSFFLSRNTKWHLSLLFVYGFSSAQETLLSAIEGTFSPIFFSLLAKSLQ